MKSSMSVGLLRVNCWLHAVVTSLFGFGKVRDGFNGVVLGDEDFECIAVLQEHSQDVKMVKWHPSEEILVSCSYDDTIKVWMERDDWECVATLLGHTSTVWAVDFDATGSKLVSVGDDKSLRVWQREGETNWTLLHTLENLHERCIYSVSWSKANGRLLTCGADNTIRVCEWIEGQGIRCIQTITQAHGDYDINCVLWCPFDEHVFASAGDDGIVRLWQMSN